MKAHPRDLKASQELDRDAFMAGVALFDTMLDAAEQTSRNPREYASMYLRAEQRYRQEPTERPAGALPLPLKLYLLPLLQRATDDLRLLPGLAAALGDYLGWIHTGLVPDDGVRNTGLQFDDVWLDSSPSAGAPGNVVDLHEHRERSASLGDAHIAVR